MRLTKLALILALPGVLVACGHDNPPATQVVIQQPSATVTPMAPMPPPPANPELVPPPPVSSTPVVWQPGHWVYTGVGNPPWSWQQGHYMAVPPGATAWVPGQWQQQGSGWVWRDGHWA